MMSCVKRAYSSGVRRPLAPPPPPDAPTLVLGSWAGYQPMGGTEDSTRAVFQAQYAKLQGVQIAMSAQGFHFLMWDDPRWLRGQVQAFLDHHH